MKLRNVLGLAVTVPALVVTLAQPGSAANQAVVSFAGTMRVTPTSSGLPQTVAVCLSALASCPDGVASTGAAAGPATGQAIDGLYAKITTSFPCAAGQLGPEFAGEIVLQAHDAVTGAWSDEIRADLTRVGSVVVILGQAVGTASFTPVGVPACDAPLTVAIKGSAVLTY